MKGVLRAVINGNLRFYDFTLFGFPKLGLTSAPTEPTVHSSFLMLRFDQSAELYLVSFLDEELFSGLVFAEA